MSRAASVCSLGARTALPSHDRAMRIALCAVFAAAFLHACGAPPPYERAVIEYVRAIRANDCDRAFSLLSARVQAALRAEQQQQHSRRNRVESHLSLHALYCAAGPYERVKLQKTRTAWRSGADAEVHLTEAVPAGYLIPGFWPTRTESKPLPMRVVLDPTGWKVDDQRLLAELRGRARARQEELAAQRKAQEWNCRRGVTLRPRDEQHP